MWKRKGPFHKSAPSIVDSDFESRNVRSTIVGFDFFTGTSLVARKTVVGQSASRAASSSVRPKSKPIRSLYETKVAKEKEETHDIPLSVVNQKIKRKEKEKSTAANRMNGGRRGWVGLRGREKGRGLGLRAVDAAVTNSTPADGRWPTRHQPPS